MMKVDTVTRVQVDIMYMSLIIMTLTYIIKASILHVMEVEGMVRAQPAMYYKVGLFTKLPY